MYSLIVWVYDNKYIACYRYFSAEEDKLVMTIKSLTEELAKKKN